jgi:hypothetical protein
MSASLLPNFSWLAFIISLVVALVTSFAKTRGGVARLGGAQSFGIGILSFICTAIGVVISYFVVLRHFEISSANIAGAAIITVIANYGSYVALKDKSKLDWQDCLLFVKEGFLWVTAYPAFAAALGFVGFKLTV